MNRALLFVVLTVAFFSCSEGKKDQPQATADTAQVKSAVQADPKTQKLDQLKAAPTTDLAALQNMLPAEMAGIKRSKFSMTSNLGYATAQADYEKNRKTYIHLSLYDCAGEQGASMYNSSFLSKLDQKQESAAGYTKTIELAGGKAIESFEAETNVTTISFLANDKILVVIAGKNFSAETLREAAQKMNMKVS